MTGDAEGVVPLVDAHCHIDLFEQPRKVLAEAETQHVYTIAVTNAPSVFSHTATLVAQSKYVRAAIGLHPELVHSHAHELSSFPTFLRQTRYVGEIGLDYTTPVTTERHEQRRVFESILRWAAEYGDKILTVHSRRAAKDVVNCVGDKFPGAVIFHWFSGSSKELEAAVRCGVYFSVNTAMLRTQRGRMLISQMPSDRVITETDGPFICDENRPNTPPDTAKILPQLAALWKIDNASARATVLNTFRKLIREGHDA